MTSANGVTAKPRLNGKVWQWIAGVLVAVLLGGGGFTLGSSRTAKQIEAAKAENAARINSLVAEVNELQLDNREFGASMRGLVAAVARDRTELLEAMARIDTRLEAIGARINRQ